MLLKFGPFKLEPKGMPTIFSLHVLPPSGPDRPVIVLVKLTSKQRAAVEKWAKKLGAEVTERTYPLFEDDPTPLEICAVAEADGVQVEIYTRTVAPVAAASAKDPDAEPDTPLLHWPSRGLSTTTSCQGEPLAAESFAASEAEVTCPGCRALLPAAPADTAGGA